MRFSTRTRYGLRFLLRLARQDDDSLLQLGQVAQEEEISPGYLEQIVRSLKPLNILHAVRGPTGGYMLTQQPSQIRLDDVIERLEGDLAPISCLRKGKGCNRAQECSTIAFWQEFDGHLRSFLRNRTLQNLLDDERRSGREGGSHVGLHCDSA